jgi:hypothetical protein
MIPGGLGHLALKFAKALMEQGEAGTFERLRSSAVGVAFEAIVS